MFLLSCGAVLCSCCRVVLSRVPAVVQCCPAVLRSRCGAVLVCTRLVVQRLRALHAARASPALPDPLGVLCAVRTGTFCTCCSLASLAAASVLLGLFRAASSLKTVQGKSDRDVRPQVKRLLEPKERSDFQLPRGGLIKPETKTAFSIRAAIV